MRSVEATVNFLIAKCLSDPNGGVALASVSAGREIMQGYGSEMLPTLLVMLEVCAAL